LPCSQVLHIQQSLQWFTHCFGFCPFFFNCYTYEKTFLGLSYSRNFVQALVLSSVVAATVMQAIGDNVGRGLGMLGALSIVRFRTSFKDPRDIMFLFAALGLVSAAVSLLGALRQGNPRVLCCGCSTQSNRIRLKTFF
jgi:hypothetical protein